MAGMYQGIMPTSGGLYPLLAGRRVGPSRIRTWGSRILLWTHERNFDGHIRLTLNYLLRLPCFFMTGLLFSGWRRGAVDDGVSHTLGNLGIGFSVYGGIERLFFGCFRISQQNLSACNPPLFLFQCRFRLLTRRETLAGSGTNPLPRRF